MEDRNIRLRCLELALASGATGKEAIVVARRYAAFVEGKAVPEPTPEP